MYLTARKRLRTYGSGNDIKKISDIGQMFGLDPFTTEIRDPIRAIEISFSAAYWRKANAIHEWFVKNVQEGEDDCREAYVDRKQLQDLVETCHAVLKDHSLAPKLLPTRSGFFFGNTDYNSFYYEDLNNTVDRLEQVLAAPAFADCSFCYQASW